MGSPGHPSQESALPCSSARSGGYRAVPQRGCTSQISSPANICDADLGRWMRPLRQPPERDLPQFLKHVREQVPLEVTG
jgi:hypothetical protein